MALDDDVAGIGVAVSTVELYRPHIVDLDVDYLEAGRLMPVPVIKLPAKRLSRPDGVDGRFVAQQYETGASLLVIIKPSYSCMRRVDAMLGCWTR